MSNFSFSSAGCRLLKQSYYQTVNVRSLCTVGSLSVHVGDFALSQPASPAITSVDGVTRMMPACQPLQQQPVPVTFIGQVSPMAVRSPTVLTGYLHRQSIGLGITLIVIGILSAVFNAVDIAVTLDAQEQFRYYSSTALVSHGLWGGFLVSNCNYTFCFTVTL